MGCSLHQLLCKSVRFVPCCGAQKSTPCRLIVSRLSLFQELSVSVHPFPTVEHVDVLIVGAGLSGIGAGYYLQKEQP